MLLETLDVKKNDVIIYSHNIFNIDKNFKIIFKDDPERIARKINYSDVCRFVNEYVPKNLIVYRLMTNIKNFQIDLSKYGFLLNINGITELIYFDPVFAVRELEEYSDLVNAYNLRFRIQQVGLTTLNRKGNLPNYAEIYSVDLEATEAKFQNDKVFADAIVTIGTPTKDVRKEAARKQIKPEIEKEDVGMQHSFAEKIKLNEKSITKEQELAREQRDSFRLISHDVSEDKDFDYKQVLRMNSRVKSSEIEQKKSTEEIASGEKKKSDFSEFLKKKATPDEKGKSEKDFADIFKTPTPLKEFITRKEDQRIVLKLDKK